MKLRIKGNSLRLRITRSEAEKIRSGEAVEETIEFSPANRLLYRLEGARDAHTLCASFGENTIRVRIPVSQALDWAAGAGIGLTAEQPLANGAILRILVEKDFPCQHPTLDEDQSDAFARPEA